MARKYMIFNDFAFVTIGRNYYRINFWFITKSKIVYRIKNSVKTINNYNSTKKNYLLFRCQMIMRHWD